MAASPAPPGRMEMISTCATSAATGSHACLKPSSVRLDSRPPIRGTDRMQASRAVPINIRALSTRSPLGLSGHCVQRIGHPSIRSLCRLWAADEKHMEASTMDGLAMREGADVKARMYRMLPVLALLAVVVEGLGAGVKWF